MGFALSIVVVAIGMTAAATDTVARCDAGSLTVSSSDGAVACAPAAAPDPVVAGYQSEPGQAQAVAAEEFARDVTARVALATGVVLFSIFVILLSYRPRPGGVRASHR